jgi:CysZ protein
VVRLPAVTTTSVADTAPADRGAGGAVRDLFTGAGLLLRGVGMYGRSPGLLLLGVLPALIAMLVIGGAFAVLAYYVDDVAGALTGFAHGWAPDARQAVRYLAAIAVLGAAGLLAILTFTAVTLAIGDPFYEKISERIERRLGGVPGAVDRPWYRDLLRNVADSVRLLALSAAVGVPLFLLGLVPVLGQVTAAVAGALVGGWILAVELTGVAFARRGMRLAQRRAALRSRRALAVGFGAATFVCFLIPFGAILLMPAAVAGATLLTRRVLGYPIDGPPAGTRE